jgi:hypothetical protein
LEKKPSFVERVWSSYTKPDEENVTIGGPTGMHTHSKERERERSDIV